MSRNLMSRLSAGLFLMLVATGCGEETRFFIVQNQVPNEGCTIPSGQSSVYRGLGHMDVALVGDDDAFGYLMFPLVRNSFPPAGQAGSPEPNRITLKGFHVAIELDPGAPAAAKQVFDALAADEVGRRYLAYDEPWSATIEPNGIRSAAVGAFPGEIARRLRATAALKDVPETRASIRIKALGSRQQGDLDTPDFRYPLSICEGCLVALGGTCPIAERKYPGNPCNRAQDDAVDCCLEGGRLRCPAPVQMMTTTPPSP